MRPPAAGKEGFRMLPLVVTAGALWADLASPLTPEEYRQVIGQQVLLHEPLRPEVRAYYRAKGRVLAGFLRPGMSSEEVRRVLGVRPNGWVRAGTWIEDTYSLLGLTVRYRIAEVGAAGKERLELLVEEVQATPP
jgi:hypothetical protein